MDVVYKKLNELKPYENNPRQNDRAVDALAESIKEYGFKVPCVIDKNGVLVTGHTRYKAAKKLGIQEIPCIVADDLSDEQINEFRLVDNKVGDISKWDKRKLIVEAAKLPKFDTAKYGFKPNDLKLRKDIFGGSYGDERERTYGFYNLRLYDEYATEGPYQMPTLEKETYVPERLLGFNYAMSTADKDQCLHFFLDDYQFERLWHTPEQYIDVLMDYTAVLTPDFSLYTEMPVAMKIWNTYRSRMLGQYWQRLGIKVIPTVSWCEPATFEWCFDGIPKGGTVAISTIGVKNGEGNETWKAGVDAMIKRLKPKTILIYGGKIDYDYGKIKTVYYTNSVTERMSNYDKG